MDHPMLKELCEALGWQGGTIWQVLAEVKRLKAENASLRFHGEKMIGGWTSVSLRDNFRAALEDWAIPHPVSEATDASLSS